MQPQIRLGKIFGIQIGLHYSWLIIALLITLSLSANFHGTNPEWPEAVIWAAALITGLLFFGAIILHELSHALVAQARGLPVRSITLFALGGVAQIEKDAADAKTEFWMGIAGPIMSVVIGVICLALAKAGGWVPELPPDRPAMAVLVWLGYINLMLAAFNMIPGFPLDGGRVLRAILWWVMGDANRATRIAATTGQAVAIGFMVIGLFRFFGGAGFGGLWLAFIGWFLLDAARAALAHLELTTGLQGVRVRDVMGDDCTAVDPQSTLEDFVDQYLMRTGRRCFVVKQNGQTIGIITPHDVRGVDRSQWRSTTVREVMRPVAELRTVTPDTPVIEALQMLGRGDVNQLPVMSNGRLEGMLTRSNVLRLLESRAELQM
jgi:Zn-dependent protease/CBS domain-containing protein